MVSTDPGNALANPHFPGRGRLSFLRCSPSRSVLRPSLIPLSLLPCLTPPVRSFYHCGVAILILLLGCVALPGVGRLERTALADDFPQFIVPGHEVEMGALNDLHRLHHPGSFITCTLWDGWLPQSSLWASAQRRTQYRDAFLAKRIDAEGYVSMQQHRGMAHSEGWPFPAWQQSTGSGFHFSIADEVWAIQSFGLKPLANTDGWEIAGAEVRGIDPAVGLRLKGTADTITLVTPPFRCGTIVAPFARIEWGARGTRPQTTATIEWLIEGEQPWPANRAVSVPVPGEMQFANIPLWRQPGHAGLLTRYRLRIDHARGMELDLKSLLTAIDTRHPITNSNYLQGCHDYFCWTHDLDFLRQNIGLMRQALEFALREFRVRDEKHVHVTWVGHDGRSGLTKGKQGQNTPRPGLGVGNNYWDLLPFGGHDALATISLAHALRNQIALEQAITRHPEWNIPPDVAPPDTSALSRLADEIRTDFQTRFWNQERGRFVGWIDATGQVYDYGFSFVNLEAIHCGLASDEQAQQIFAWLDGRREVAGDTSRGADIYHWRFAPRATTRRNIDTYVWAWTSPESVPWGDQVQDGGGVLGFSYHDIMARLKTNGPDDAWRRLREIATWFREVQAEGGYRAYYAKPGRGKLQGGGTAGGLGLDQEFLESVLVPQVLLQGFLGFHPTPEGYTLQPRLPRDWPSLTITGIRLRDDVLDITAHADGRVEVQRRDHP